DRTCHRVGAWPALLNSVLDDLQRLWNLILLRSPQSQALESTGNHRFHAYGITGRNSQDRRQRSVVITPVNILWLQLQIVSFGLSPASEPKNDNNRRSSQDAFHHRRTLTRVDGIR